MKQRKPYYNQGEVTRVRTPKGRELLGRVEMLHGGRRMRVKCSDDKIRICRVPGRVRVPRIREEDYVLIEPWEIEGDKKGDVLYKYRANQVDWLRRKGFLKNL